MLNLMRNRVNVYRPVTGQGTSTTAQIIGYTAVYQDVACFVQPYDTLLEDAYSQRQTTQTHVLYTCRTDCRFQREDIFEDASGNQFHAVANPKNALWLGLYSEIPLELYPEASKKRLNM